MKYSINERTNIGKIPADTEEIHLVRPVKREKLERLLRKCSGLKKIYLSKSCLQRLPKKTREIFVKYGVELLHEERRGRAIGMQLEKMMNVVEMARDDRPLREIEQITGIPKSTVHYLVKYAERGKVKQGKEIIYLK